MVAHVNTVAFAGIEVLPIEAQVAISGGLPTFTIVGLPDKAVGESRERVRADRYRGRKRTVPALLVATRSRLSVR